MAGKITDLTTIAAIDPANDVLEIVDVSASASNKVTPQGLFSLTSNAVGLNDTQTLTNKTLTAPTIASPILSGTITGTYTLAGTPTFPTSVVTLTGTQTLTGKTLTSPTINSPTITNANITADAITGFTTANNGTVYGLAVTAGVLGSNALAPNAVQANQLSTSTIFIAYSQITANVTGLSSSSPAQIAGMTVTATIPSGGRKVKVSAYIPYLNPSVALTGDITLWDGAVGSGTKIGQYTFGLATTSSFAAPWIVAVVTPAAGSKTYNLAYDVNTGNITVNANTTFPAFMLVEAI